MQIWYLNENLLTSPLLSSPPSFRTIKQISKSPLASENPPQTDPPPPLKPKPNQNKRASDPPTCLLHSATLPSAVGFLPSTMPASKLSLFLSLPAPAPLTPFLPTSKGLYLSASTAYPAADGFLRGTTLSLGRVEGWLCLEEVECWRRMLGWGWGWGRRACCLISGGGGGGGSGCLCGCGDGWRWRCCGGGGGGGGCL